MQRDRQVSPYCRDSGSGWKVKWATRRFWAASSPPGCRKPCTSAAQRSPHRRRSAPAAPSRSSPPARAATAAIPGSQALQPTLPAGRAELRRRLPHWAASRGGFLKETNRRWKFGGGDGDAMTWRPAQTEAVPRALQPEMRSMGVKPPQNQLHELRCHSATGCVLIQCYFCGVIFSSFFVLKLYFLPCLS